MDERRSTRPLIMGRRGAVASNHPLATQAGLDMLRVGGNAADAAAAVALALGVVEPCLSGLGGDGFYHVFMAPGAVARVYNGSGAAPARATPERYAATGMPQSGGAAASTPGSLAAIHAMQRAHGALAWADVCAPAIALARDGFAVTHNLRRFTRMMLPRVRADAMVSAIFLREGEPLPLGSLLVQRDLADTLSAIAAGGADAFYRGALGKALARAARAAGAPFDADDLAACEAEVQAPIAATYRGFEVRQTPPNSTGFVLLQELKIAERFDLAALGPESPELVHLLVEAKKRAFRDRERHAGDPRRAAVPVDALLAESHIDRLAAGIDRERAATMPVRWPLPADGDTTYFCVVDAAGNAVSAIQSLNTAFGAGAMAAGTGVLLNNRMTCWHLDPGHPNALAPGKRVRHTMNAPMILRDGRVWALLGTPGADNQVQINLQAAVWLIDHGFDPQRAAEAPRWSSSQRGQEANWPHGGDDALTLERDFPAATVEGLRARGHEVKLVPPLEGPCSLACIRVLDNGVRMAGSDPRRDGWAAAY